MGMSKFARDVIYGFTKGVFETNEPQLTSDNAGYNPLIHTESQWASSAFDDEFIFQEYSSFPDRDCHGGETIWNMRVRTFDAARDFNDSVEQQSSANDDPDLMAWKTQRPSFTKTLKQAFRWGTVLSILVAGIIGALCMMYSYVSLQTSDMCWWLHWEDIPHNVQWYIEVCVYIKICLYRFSYFVSILLIFKRSQIKGLRMKLFIVTFVFTLLDISYKAVLQLTGALQRKTVLWLPGNVMLFIALIAQAGILSGRFRNDVRGKLWLTMKFALPWALGRCAKYTFVYGVYPWYRKSNQMERFLIAMAAPICVVIFKAVSRLCVQRLWGINHPGTSFIFLAPLYCVSALFTRFLQANLGNLKLIIIIAVIHGLVEVVERSSMALRDHIGNQIIEKRFASCGTFRNTRSERLHTDIIILSMLQESISIVAVNGFVCVLGMVYSSPDELSEVIQTWMIKTALQLLIECFFSCISFAIATHFQNMPIRRVWKSKWYLHVAIALILASTSFSSSTGYYYVLIDTSFIDASRQKCGIPFL